MNTMQFIAGLLIYMMCMGVTGCGQGNSGSTDENSAPATRRTTPAGPRPTNIPRQYAPVAQKPAHKGMSTTTKVVLLVGAAALYYMYKQHQKAKGEGPQGVYYRSKNGQVYYRDKNHNPHFITAPAEGISVPAANYERDTGQQAPSSDGSANTVIRDAPANG